MAVLEPTDPIWVAVESGLRDYLSSLGLQEYQEVGGVRSCAEILNSLDRDSQKGILDSLYQDQSELSDSIKKLMFVFEDVIHVYRKLRDEGLDLVKTYRTERGDGFYRKTISIAYNIIFKILFPGLNCRDINSKPKIMTRKVYNCMNLNSNGWFIDAEIMIQAGKMNLKIGETPTIFHQINYRSSFVKFRSVWEFFVNLIWYRLFSKAKI